MNETILPVDFEQAGMMTDDHIGDLIVKHLPEGVRLTVLLDCCHSGTGLDLPFQWQGQGRGWREETNPYHSRGDVQLISGCMDDQTSADAANAYGAPGGAMTTALCDVLRSNCSPTYPQLMELLHVQLRRRGFSQRPQLTASQRFDTDRLFRLEGAVPNSNSNIGRTFRKKFRPQPRYIDGPLLDTLLDAGMMMTFGMMVAPIGGNMLAPAADMGAAGMEAAAEAGGRGIDTVMSLGGPGLGGVGSALGSLFSW